MRSSIFGFGITLVCSSNFHLVYAAFCVCVQPEPRPSGASHLLDSGCGWSLPDAGAVRGQPGPGAEIPQLTHRERSRHVSITTLLSLSSFAVIFVAHLSYVSCPSRSCYVVFPCQQIVLCLGCLMGLVMFARYGEDSPLDKGYVKTNDQVKTHLPSWFQDY